MRKAERHKQLLWVQSNYNWPWKDKSSDCCLNWASVCCSTPSEQFIRYITTRTSYILTRWRRPLYTRPIWCWIFILLSQWNKSLQVNMSLHSDTLFRFLANQSLLLLHNNTTCLSEQIPILKFFGMTQPHNLPYSRKACQPLITPPMWRQKNFQYHKIIMPSNTDN